MFLFGNYLTRIVENRIWGDQTLKIKKLRGTQVHGARVPFKTPLLASLNAALGMEQSN